MNEDKGVNVVVDVTSEELVRVPFDKSFSGHETFPFRHSWLKKGVDNLITDPEVFHREDAIVRLGVGKNMVRSIRHWCIATRMAQKSQSRGVYLYPSELGLRLLSDEGWDPFLEDDATLWLIHWNLTSAGTHAATWYWAFHRYNEYIFNKEKMTESLTREVQKLGWSGISVSTIKKDVECFLNTYISSISRRVQGTIETESLECPLTSLDILMQESDSQRIRFRVGPKTMLPPEIFAYGLGEYWNWKNPKSKSLELGEIMRSEGSPVQVFKLDEESVLYYLDNLADLSSKEIVFQDTALIRRVVKNTEYPINSMSFLEAYYETK